MFIIALSFVARNVNCLVQENYIVYNINTKACFLEPIYHFTKYMFLGILWLIYIVHRPRRIMVIY